MTGKIQKGEKSPVGSVTKIRTIFGVDEKKLYVELPTDLQINDWKSNDEVEWEESELCYDWGEVQGLILRNLTKEK